MEYNILQGAKILESKIKYHKKTEAMLLEKVDKLNVNISNANLSGNGRYVLHTEFSETKEEQTVFGDDKQGQEPNILGVFNVTIKNSSYVGIGELVIRPKALVTYLKIEAQYHNQEAKKYKRQLERL